MKLARLKPGAIAVGVSLGLATSAFAGAAPKKPEVVAPADLETAFKGAQLQRQSGDLEGATRTLSQLVLATPDDGRVLGEYGKTLLDKGEIRDALAFLQRAADLVPDDWSIHSALGVAHTQNGNYAAAQLAFARALALKPGEAAVLNNQALAHLQAGNLDIAEQLLYQAIQSGARHPRVAQNLALVQSLRQARAAAQAAQAAAQPPAQQPPPAAPAPATESATQSAPQPVETPAAPATPESAPVPTPKPLLPVPPEPPTSRSVSLPKPVARGTLAEIPAQPARPAPAELALPRGPVAIQIASYNSQEQAAGLAAKIGMGARVTEVLHQGKAVYRVRIGPMSDHEEVREMLGRLHGLGYRDARAFPADESSAPRAGTPALRLSGSAE